MKSVRFFFRMTGRILGITWFLLLIPKLFVVYVLRVRCVSPLLYSVKHEQPTNHITLE